MLSRRTKLGAIAGVTAGLTFLSLSAVVAVVRPGGGAEVPAEARAAVEPPAPEFRPRVVEPAAGGREAARPARERRSAPPASRRRTRSDGLGQLVITRMAGTYPSAALLARVRQGKVGGVILFGDNIRSTGQVAGAVRALQAAARAGGRPPLLIAADQEGGQVKRFASMAPTVSAALTGSAAEAARQGAASATDLRGAGVNVNLAPVADVPTSSANFLAQTGRAYGTSPGRVANLACAFADGTRGNGVVPAFKHFPGLGHAGANTDLSSVTIPAGAEALRSDLLPYRRCAGQGMVMMSNAAYPALGDAAPAVLSPAVVGGLLRGEIGFRGVVITDDLETPGVSRYPDAAVRAVNAGVDLLLYAKTEAASAAAHRALMAARHAGRLDPAAVRAALRRVRVLKRTLS